MKPSNACSWVGFADTSKSHKRKQIEVTLEEDFLSVVNKHDKGDSE